MNCHSRSELLIGLLAPKAIELLEVRKLRQLEAQVVHPTQYEMRAQAVTGPEDATSAHMGKLVR